MARRIVVTGLGLVTPVGTGREEVWENLLAGASGVGPVRSFDTSRFNVHVGAEIKDFRPGDHIRTLDTADLGRASSLAVAAARMAVADGELSLDEVDPWRAGVAMGGYSPATQLHRESPAVIR